MAGLTWGRRDRREEKEHRECRAYVEEDEASGLTEIAVAVRRRDGRKGSQRQSWELRESLEEVRNHAAMITVIIAVGRLHRGYRADPRITTDGVFNASLLL